MACPPRTLGRWQVRNPSMRSLVDGQDKWVLYGTPGRIHWVDSWANALNTCSHIHLGLHSYSQEGQPHYKWLVDHFGMVAEEAGWSLHLCRTVAVRHRQMRSMKVCLLKSRRSLYLECLGHASLLADQNDCHGVRDALVAAGAGKGLSRGVCHQLEACVKAESYLNGGHHACRIVMGLADVDSCEGRSSNAGTLGHLCHRSQVESIKRVSTFCTCRLGE